MKVLLLVPYLIIFARFNSYFQITTDYLIVKCNELCYLILYDANKILFYIKGLVEKLFNFLFRNTQKTELKKSLIIIN